MKHPLLMSCTMTLLSSAICACFSPAHAAGAKSPDSAIAGQAASAAPSDQAITGQETNKPKTQAEKDADAQKQATELSGITVSPLRSSLQSAQLIKQDARVVVDSIVAEDIGKLPDNSVAEAMQRITGVQVAQSGKGETSSVVIRGLPNVVTTLNGREIVSGAGRAFAFQNLPATAVKTIKVYKASEASLPDGGIAGVVDLQLFRPFDFAGSKLAGSFTTDHRKYGGKTDPTFSALASTRWDTDIGEVGALINVGFRSLHYDYNAVWGGVPVLAKDANGAPVRTPDGNLVSVPNGLGATYNMGYQQRPEVNYALQWKPNESTEFYVESLFDWDSDKFTVATGSVGAGGSGLPASNLQVSNHCYPVQLPGSPYEGQTTCDANGGSWSGNSYTPRSTQAHLQNGHDTQHAIGVKWHGERLRLSSDLSYNESSFSDNSLIIDTFLKGPITTDWTGTSGNHQNWTLPGNPQLNPDNYYLNGLFQNWSTQRGKQYVWRGDGTYDINGSFFQYLDFGARYSDHTAESSGAVQISTPPPGGAGTGNLAGNPNPDNQVTSALPGDFLCSSPSTPVVPNPGYSPCYDYLIANSDALRNYYGLPSGLAPENPGRHYNINEKTYAGYIQAAYGNELFGMPFDGLMGFRMERVKRNLDAFSYDASTNIYSPLSASTSEPVYLPNFSFNWHFTDALQLRLDAAKTVSYPGFGQLNPSLSLNPGTINRAGAASSGNPDLDPIKSNNYDASLEWYFAPASYVSGGVFYRDITGYVQNYVTNVVINNEDYQFSAPQSAGSGHLDGAELAYQQFFDFLPGALSGFGVQLNYTYIEGSTRSPQYIGGPTVVSPLQNVSKNNGNAVLMYEKYGLSARLAYNYRSRYIDGFNQQNVAGVYDEVVPANQLDLSVGYELNQYTTVVATATNLLHSNFHQYWGEGTSRPRDIRYQDRTVGLGVRFKL